MIPRKKSHFHSGTNAPTGKCDIKTDRQIRRVDTAHGRWSAKGISLSKQVKAPMLATVNNTKRMAQSIDNFSRGQVVLKTAVGN
jgi:hypothetical protein